MAWPQGDDPLAGYTPDWRKRLFADVQAGSSTSAQPDDPLAGYSPDWRTRFADVEGGSSSATLPPPPPPVSTARAVFGSPEQLGIPDQPDFFQPGVQETGTIDLTTRPRVQNPDGSVSTVKSFSINEDGREILLPLVSDDGRLMSEDEAVQRYHQTGRHLGVFDSPEAADAYAQQLHQAQALATAPRTDPELLADVQRTAQEGVEEGPFSRAYKTYNQRALRELRQGAANVLEQEVIYPAEALARTGALMTAPGRPELYGKGGDIQQLRDKALELTDKLAGGEPRDLGEKAMRYVGPTGFLGAYQLLRGRGARAATEAVEQADEAIPDPLYRVPPAPPPIDPAEVRGLKDAIAEQPRFESRIPERRARPRTEEVTYHLVYDAQGHHILSTTDPEEAARVAEERFGVVKPKTFTHSPEPAWLDEVGPDGKGGTATVRQMREQMARVPITAQDRSLARIQLRRKLVTDLEQRQGWEEATLDDVLPSGMTKRQVIEQRPVRPPDQPKRAYVILGYPASGKSTTIADRIFEEHPWARVLDSDESKKTIPEYLGGANANGVHDESKEMMYELMARSMDQGHDVILPIIGDNPNTVKAYLDLLERNGYQVHLAQNDVTRANALKRLLHRWRRTGRYVDPGLIFKAKDPGLSYEINKEHPAVTSWERWNNDRPLEEGGAYLVERGSRPGGLEAPTRPGQPGEGRPGAPGSAPDLYREPEGPPAPAEPVSPPAAPPVSRETPGPYSQALADLHPPETRAQELERLYGSDEALGVTYDEANEMSVLPNGEGATTCTNCAREIVRRHGGGRIVGYADRSNPTAGATGNFPGSGHDFAILEDRYIVDPWVKETSGASERAVFDLTDPADQSEIRRLYGEPSKWVQVDGPKGPIPKPLGFTEAERMAPAARAPEPEPPLPEPTARGTATRIESNTGATDAEYVALPADQVIPSNRATDLGPFDVHPLHPGNERTYSPGSDQHLGVLKQAGEWKPQLVLNTDPTPVGGPPIVVPWTRELAEATGKRWEDVRGTYWTAGGNSRVMAQDLLRQRGRGAVVDAANLNASPAFGLPDVPPGNVIVRLVKEPITTPEQARALVSRLNEVPTKALGVEESAVSAGQKMSAETRDWFASVYNPDQTLRANLQNLSVARELRDRLSADGVIDASTRGKLWHVAGPLTEEGKTFIERMMLGRAVPDASLLQTATPQMVGKIESIASLVDRSSVGGPAYDLREPLAEILRRQGGQNVSLERHLAQLDMLQAPPDESVTNLWRMVDELSTKELRERLSRYVDIIEKRVVRSDAGMGLGLEDPTPIPSPTEAMGAAEVARKPTYKTRGGALVQTPAAIAGAALGGAVGANQDQENPSRGLLLGLLAGGAAGLAAGKLAKGRLPRARPGTFEGELEAVRAQAERGQASRFLGPVDPEEYVNSAKFALDESGTQRLRAEVTRIVQDEGIHPKQVISWDQTRAMARRLGLDHIERADVNTRLGGPEMLAIRNVVSSNLEQLDGLYAKLQGPLDDVARHQLDRTIGALERQNDNLLNRFIRARTQTGRDLNNLKILANRVMDPVAWVAKAANMLEAAGKKLTVAQRDQIRALVEAGDKRALVEYMVSLRPPNRGAQAMSLWKTGLLTNPKTHLANILGNTAMAGLEQAKELPSALVDRILGLGTGQRAKSFSPIGDIRASWRGAKEGLQEAKDILKYGTPSDMDKWERANNVTFKNPIARLYTQTITRGLAAPDAFFRKVALHRAMAELERLGPVTAEKSLQAVADAEYAVFQGGGRQAGVQSRLAQAGEGLRRPLGPVGHVIAPFTRTPGNVIGATIDYSPFGAIRGARDVYRLVKAVRAEASPAEIQALQRAASEQLGRTITGTAGAFLGGYILARNGRMTGARPTDNRTQDQWDLAGKQENAVRLGNRWWSLSRLSPVGNLMALGANYYYLTQNPEAGTGGAIAGALGSIGTTATEQSFLRGVQELNKAVEDPAGQAGKYAKNLVASTVPAIVGAVAREMDPVIRDTKGGFFDTFQSRVPGMSQNLPAQVDQLGREKRRDAVPGGNLFDPTTSRAYRLDDPVIRELERTGAGIGELNQGRARPAEVRKLESALRNTRAPTTRALLERRLERAKEGESRGQYLVRSGYEGRVLNEVLQRIIANPNYQRLPDESRKEVLEAATTKVRQQLSRELRRAGVD